MTHESPSIEIQKLFSGAIKSAFPMLETYEAEIARSKEAKFGDYQCNIAMKLAKVLHSSPKDIAKQIVAFLPEQSIFSSVSITDPGFINVSLSSQYLQELIREKITRNAIIPLTGH